MRQGHNRVDRGFQEKRNRGGERDKERDEEEREKEKRHLLQLMVYNCSPRGSGNYGDLYWADWAVFPV